MKRSISLGLVFVFVFSSSIHAAVTLPAMFSDHMVLQRGMEVPVWGTANPNEKVAVEYAGKVASATADANGKWSCKLPALSLGDATSLTIKAEGGDAVIIKDVLVGDVWICSGQSNMGFQVKSGKNAEKEIAAANYPNIRMFKVPNVTSVDPTTKLKGDWKICTPETAGDFTAVGYFFGRQIHADEKAPVGLIDNSWGGMPAESFASKEMLESDADFKPLLNRKEAAMKIPQADREKAAKGADAWDAKYILKDSGNENEKKGWAKADFDDSAWKPMELPKHWEDDGLKIDGSVWFRKTIELPKDWAGEELMLGLGGIDDCDTTYVNGKQVGKTEGVWAIFVSRQYTVPAELTKDGKLVIAVRVFDRGGTGGFYGPAVSMTLAKANARRQHPMSLAGKWMYAIEKGVPQPENVPPRPSPPTSPDAPNLASNIYNAMVNPLIPYAVKAAVWYQGESNADRAQQYRKLFPAMIKDWRNQWSERGGEADFPFFFVQLANYGNGHARSAEPSDSNWAELREAQTMTLKASPNTAMAVIIDIGETKDIHPKNKQDVGKRLALAAEKMVYGKTDAEWSGPMFESMSVDGDKVRLKFSHADGLMTRDGDAKGFAVAGEDQKFHWAEAKIDGGDVIVSSKDVEKPVAVRYGWADDPEVNVFNGAGLPMCPFRTDDWKMITAGKK